MSKPNNYPSWGKDLDIDSIISNIDSSRFTIGYPKDKGIYPTVDEWNYLGKMQNDWIKYLDAAVDDLDSRVSGNTSDIDSLSNRVTSNQSRISVLESDVSTLETDVANVKSDVQNNSENIVKLNEIAEVKQALCEIQSGTATVAFSHGTPLMYRSQLGVIVDAAGDVYRLYEFSVNGAGINITISAGAQSNFTLVIPESLRLKNGGGLEGTNPEEFVFNMFLYNAQDAKDHLVGVAEPVRDANNVVTGIRITIDNQWGGDYNETWFIMPVISIKLREIDDAV